MGRNFWGFQFYFILRLPLIDLPWAEGNWIPISPPSRSHPCRASVQTRCWEHPPAQLGSCTLLRCLGLCWAVSLSGRCCSTSTKSRDLSLHSDFRFHLNSKWVTNHRPKHVVLSSAPDTEIRAVCWLPAISQVGRWALPQTQLTSFPPCLGSLDKCILAGQIQAVVLFLICLCSEFLPLGSSFLHKGSVLQLFCWFSAVFLGFFLRCLSYFHRHKLWSSDLWLLILKMGKFLMNFAFTVAFYLLVSVDLFTELKLDTRFCGMEICEVALVFIFLFEEVLDSCTDLFERLGMEGKVTLLERNSLSFF